MEIIQYSASSQIEWDTFVHQSRNGTFLFCRDFMEYHSDRFSDYSLMFYSNKHLIAILPGNISGDRYYSHQGLTYGGLIISNKTTSIDVLSIFTILTKHLREKKIKQFIYKSIPTIYHKYPCEEDQYALFRNGFLLTSSSIASVIQLENKLAYAQLRKRKIKQAKKQDLSVKEIDNLDVFWTILESNLSQRHNTKPVHNLHEIKYLKKKFSHEIRLFCTFKGEELIAGCIIFETENVAHVQYISANETGKQLGGLDILFDHLICDTFKNKKYFDFGTSNEDNGQILNEGLITQKEGFGARGISYNTHLLTIESNLLNEF